MRYLKYGIGAAFFLSITFTLVYSLDWYKSFRLNATSILDLAAIVLSVYFYLREIKKKKYPEGVSFWKAAFEGMKVILIAAVLTSVFNYSYFQWDNKSFNRYKSYTIETQIKAAQNANFTTKEVKDYVDLIQRELTPANKAKENFFIVTLLGLVFVLILAAIVRKKDNPYTGFDSSELKKD